MTVSIDLIDLDAGVVLLQDLLILAAGHGHAVGAHLAEADTVAPAAPREGELVDAALLVIGPVHHEKRVAQPQRRPDLEAVDARPALGPDQDELGRPAGIAAALDLDVDEGADRIGLADKPIELL